MCGTFFSSSQSQYNELNMKCISEADDHSFPPRVGTKFISFLKIQFCFHSHVSLPVVSIHTGPWLVLFFHFWSQWKIRMKTMKIEHFKCQLRPTKSWWYHVHEISSRDIVCFRKFIHTHYNKQLPGYNLVSALITVKSAYYKASQERNTFILVWYRLSKTTVTVRVMDMKCDIRIVFNTVFKDIDCDPKLCGSELTELWIAIKRDRCIVINHCSNNKRWQCSSLACHAAI